MLKPALALLDETDSGLDVDAVKTVASGIKAYHNADNALIIITHNAKILRVCRSITSMCWTTPASCAPVTQSGQ